MGSLPQHGGGALAVGIYGGDGPIHGPKVGQASMRQQWPHPRRLWLHLRRRWPHPRAKGGPSKREAAMAPSTAIVAPSTEAMAPSTGQKWAKQA